MDSMQPVIGESPLLNEALDHLSSLATIDRPVLVTGERGTGKEIAASRLHFLSSRWQAPFIKLNCASLPESLLDSELFGYEPGAFTGARKSHAGRFERAHNGTLFLDEVGTMPTALQEKLLRVIEYGELERIGGNETLSVDVRIVAATNANLPELASRGAFRWDLLDRLTFDVVTMPALRGRGSDLQLLAEHFAMKFAAESGWNHFPGFTTEALQHLFEHAWPGNVRELKNAIERSLHRQGDDSEPLARLIIDPFNDHAPSSALPGAAPEPETARASSDVSIPNDLRAALDLQERQWLRLALEQTGHRQKQAAERLGLSYDQIRGLMKKHGLRTRGTRD